MVWFRIDNRLVHGQIIEAWLPYLDAASLVVVNDKLAEDIVQQQIMGLAIPERISVTFVSVNNAKVIFDHLESTQVSSLFLFANCEDVTRLFAKGVDMANVNVGNMHFSVGKRQICAHVAVSGDDICCFDFLRENGVLLDFRCIPGDVPVVEEW